MLIIGFDPGKDKCGIALMSDQGEIREHEVVESQKAIAKINSLLQKQEISRIVLGNQTTSKQWQSKLISELSKSVEITRVDERNSTLEARDRYWEIYPPRGITRLLPKGMRLPPRPIDDIVAIILIERYLQIGS